MPIILLIGGALPVAADYVVDVDLGILPIGSTFVSGTTAETVIDPGPPEVTIGGNNNSVFPKGLFEFGPVLNWGNEIVYRFELTQMSVVSITSSDIDGDPDFFLLEGLDTSIHVQSGKVGADNAIAAALLDFAPPETETFPALPPGTYYLAVEHYDGQNGSVVPGDADFEIFLTVSVELGHIARTGTPITLDTFGSEFNTELAIYNRIGTLLAANDDAGDGEQSEIAFTSGLATGRYFAVIAGHDTVFDPGFALSGSGEVGFWNFNYPYGPTFGPGFATGVTDSSPGGDAQFFAFIISPAPANATELGTIVNADEAFVLNTRGSNFDTEIALYDTEGFQMFYDNDIFFEEGSEDNNFQSELVFNDGLPAGDYYLAVAGWPHFFSDGFFVVPDAFSTSSGVLNLNYPLGPSSRVVGSNAQAWYRFSVAPVVAPSIVIQDIQFDSVTNEFTVAWNSTLPGPFNIFVGTAGQLSALSPPPGNVLPRLGVASVTSPATFTVPADLQGEPGLFLQVTD